MIRLSVLLLLCLAACHKHVKQPAVVAPPKHGVCFAARDAAAFAQPVRAHDWLKLLVQLELGRGGIYAVRDCAGEPIRWRPPAACSGEPLADEAAARPVAIGQEAVIERHLGSDTHLIWIVTHRFDDGDGFGPLALAHRARAGLEVDALGTLRMRTERVNLERWTVDGEAVVVASGETCTQAGKDPGCRRAVRLAVQRAQALLEPPVLEPSGRCLQQPHFELTRRHEQQLPSGLQRSFQLTANVSHDARYVVVEERLVVRDTDPSAPLLPPREVQRIETNRFIHAEAGQLTTRQHSLWKRAVESAANPTSAHAATRYK